MEGRQIKHGHVRLGIGLKRGVLSRTIPVTHSRDLRLSPLTYANNPSPTQITLRRPSPQTSNAEHNKHQENIYCSSTRQDSFPRPGHRLLTITSTSDSDSLTPRLHFYCIPSLTLHPLIFLPCTISTLPCLATDYILHKSYKYVLHVSMFLYP